MRGFIINHELNRIFTKEGDATEAMLFYGIVEDGRSFIWKQTNPYILTFLNSELPEKHQKQVWKKIENAFTDYRKNPVWGYFFKNQNSLNELQIEHPDLDYHESDVLAGEQFLMSKYIRGSVDFISEPEEIDGDIVYFTNPEVNAIKELFIPPVRVLSIDIETGIESDQIYSIALYGDGMSQVLLQNPSTTPLTMNPSHDWGEIISYPDEAKLLIGFQKMVQEYNPHVFIGWNVMGFDFSFIHRKFTEHGIEPIWGIGNSPTISFKKNDKGKSSLTIKIPGRAIIEGIDMVKYFFDPLPNYKLNTAAEYILDKQKTIEKEGKAKIEEIERLYREDKVELARYNLTDAELVYQIFAKLKGIDFIFNTSVISGVTPEKIFNPHEVMDRYYIPLLHKNKISAYRRLDTHVKIPSHTNTQSISGGLYNDVVVIEWKDIFPCVIMAYRIDPLGMIRAHLDKEESSITPSGTFFHNHDYILPHIIKNLFDLRIAAEKESLKILTTSIDNVLQQVSTCFREPYSRYFLPGLYDVVEANVKLVVEAIVNRIESPHQVIFYDNTCMAIQTGETIKDFSNYFIELVNQDFLFNLLPNLEGNNHYLFSIKQILNFKQFFMPQQVSSLKNKSYFKYWALDPEDVFVKQTTEKPSLRLVDHVCDQVIYRLFKQEDIETYVKDLKKNLKAGTLDNDLVFKKRLPKRPSEYSGTGMPPQVVAALKVKEEFEGAKFFPRNIEYYQTVNGPEPVQALKSDLDYNYYLEKEIFPALKSILANSNKSELFQSIENQDHQLSLF